jgi:hypothetical protein
MPKRAASANSEISDLFHLQAYLFLPAARFYADPRAETETVQATLA